MALRHVIFMSHLVRKIALISCFYPFEIITIHHECPCRIEISHPRGQIFSQSRGLPSPWLNSDPEGDISLSYMDRLMMNCFLPLFEGLFSEHKNLRKNENLNFLPIGFTTFLSLRVFLSGIDMGVNLVIAWNTRLEIQLSCNMPNKFLLGAPCH